MSRFKGQIVLVVLAVVIVTGMVVGSRQAAAQPPAQGSAPVTIVGTLPVPVSVDFSTLTAILGEGQREIVSREVTVNFGGGGGACSSEKLEVASGKRLVLEHVSSPRLTERRRTASISHDPNLPSST